MTDEQDNLLSDWLNSMKESDGCVHENEIYCEGERMYLVCKKCDKSWPV